MAQNLTNNPKLSKGSAEPTKISSKRLKADAMALAELIYDIYKEQHLKESGIINNGQNNAKQTIKQ